MTAEQTLSFLAKRQATHAMPVSTWSNVLSLELGWASPAEAKAFVAACLEAGLLRREDDEATLTFDPVEVPRGYRFDGELPASGFGGQVDRFARQMSIDRETLLARIGEVQERFGGLLRADVALLLVAAEAGIDVRSEALMASSG